MQVYLLRKCNNRKRINANDSININVIDTVTNTDNGYYKF